MLEWRKSTRAECYILEHDGKRLDVWHVMENCEWLVGKGWKWTVEDEDTGIYTASGLAPTLDAACAAAMHAAGI